MTVLHRPGNPPTRRIERDAWLIDGRLTFDRYAGAAETIERPRIACSPGFVDAHCHIGLAPEGHVPDPDGQATQAKRDRDAGALLLRDAGSPVDNTGVQRRERSASRLISEPDGTSPGRTDMIRDLGVEGSSRMISWRRSERQAGRGDGWVSWRATGSIGRPVILGRSGPTTCSKDAVARAHELGAPRRGARVRRGCFACPDHRRSRFNRSTAAGSRRTQLTR